MTTCSHDGKELFCLQARAPDKDTVYPRLTKECERIVGLDAATVLNCHLGGKDLSTNLTKLSSYEQVHIVCL